MVEFWIYSERMADEVRLDVLRERREETNIPLTKGKSMSSPTTAGKPVGGADVRKESSPLYCVCSSRDNGWRSKRRGGECGDYSEAHGGRSGKSGATGVWGGLRAGTGRGRSGGTCQERPKPEPRSPSVFRSQEAEEAERPVGKTRQSGAPDGKQNQFSQRGKLISRVRSCDIP